MTKKKLANSTKTMLWVILLLVFLIFIGILGIKLIDSKKPTLPDFSTMEISEVKQWMNDNKLNVNNIIYEYVYSDIIEEDAIVSQTPAIDSEVTSDSTITLYISKGPETIEEEVVIEPSTDEILMQVLNNEHEFDYMGTQTLFKECEFTEGQMAKAAAYALVDLTQNGQNELVVLLTSELGFYLVFHEEDEVIYGHLVGYRELTNLKTDGSSYGSLGADSGQYQRIVFDKEEMKVQVTAYSSFGSYIIDGEDVSEDKYKEYQTAFEAKEDVTMIPYESDDVDLLFTVPDFSTKTESEIKAWANEQGVEVIFETEERDTLDNHTFISQSPAAQTDIYSIEGFTLTIVYSAYQQVHLPWMQNETKDYATKWGKDNGIYVRFEERYSDKISSGNVISTLPNGPLDIDYGSTIWVYISKGSITMPNFTGKYKEDVVEWIDEVNAEIVDSSDYLSYEYKVKDSTLNNGIVLETSVSAGNKVALGTKITITVANHVDKTSN